MGAFIDSDNHNIQNIDNVFETYKGYIKVTDSVLLKAYNVRRLA